MLNIVNIVFKDDDKVTYSNIDIELEDGSLLVLKGNGSNKLLEIISGNKKPKKGKIIWQDKKIKKQSDNLHYIVQNNDLDDTKTVKELIENWSDDFGNPELAMAVIVYFQLEPILYTPYHELSKSWKKMLPFAKLLLSPRSLFLLDNPFADLDKEGIELLKKLIISRCEQKGIVILSSEWAIDLPFGEEIDVSTFAK